MWMVVKVQDTEILRGDPTDINVAVADWHFI